MGLFKHVVYGTGAIMVAEPVSRVVTAGIGAVAEISKDESKAFNEGYKKGFTDAMKIYERKGGSR